MSIRRAKIVCTIGPAVRTNEKIAELITAGMDVARLNFSHGTHADHGEMARIIRAESARLGKPVALLQDLCGPKIRTGKTGPAALERGQTVALVANTDGDASTLGVSYDTLAEDVHPGDRILLGDGHVELTVERIDGARVLCRVEHGGSLRARMGVNLPSERVRVRAITDKDRADLAFGLELGVDYVALSFVRDASDVEELRALCRGARSLPPIVAKIETPSAVKNLESIVKAADGAMVARGDLGVELPPEQVPVVQRSIIGTCRRLRKPVIVATEMLQSMVESPRPTRAETSDVAGAVFGDADAVMLSAESATGKYPIESVGMMDRIIRAAEVSPFFELGLLDPDPEIPDAVAHGACAIAREVEAKIIVAMTQSGGTARLISKARPQVPILALSPEEGTLRRLALFWGVSPRALPVLSDFDLLVEKTRDLVRSFGLVSGDTFVIVYGAPMAQRGSTNAIRVERLP
jgi:pyruvate kinase